MTTVYFSRQEEDKILCLVLTMAYCHGHSFSCFNINYQINIMRVVTL